MRKLSPASQSTQACRDLADRDDANRMRAPLHERPLRMGLAWHAQYHGALASSHRFCIALVLACGFGLAGSAAEAAHAEREARMFFENQIRPLLANRCYECHGAKKQKSGLRLD